MKAGDGIRKRGKKWYVRWTDVHGVRQDEPTEARTRIEARELRAALVSKASEQRLGIWKGDPELTVCAVWEKYEPVARTRADWGTIDGHWRNHIKPWFGNKKMRHISRDEVRKFLAAKAETTLSPRTREALRVRLGALFTFAIEEGHYRGEHVPSKVESVEIPEAEPRALPFEVVQLVIDAVPLVWRAFFALAVYTGMRSGELRALRHAALSPDWRFFKVQRSGARLTTKTKKSRNVPIPSAALNYLREAVAVSAGKEWLFVTATGKQLPRSIETARILRRALEKLGLVTAWTASCVRGCKLSVPLAQPKEEWRCPKCTKVGRVQPDSPFTFHDLRKTWETYMHELINDPMAVFQMAGHSPEVAMQHYIARNAHRLGLKADLLDFKRAAPSLPHAAQEAPANDGAGQSAGEVVVGSTGGKRG